MPWRSMRASGFSLPRIILRCAVCFMRIGACARRSDRSCRGCGDDGAVAACPMRNGSIDAGASGGVRSGRACGGERASLDGVCSLGGASGLAVRLTRSQRSRSSLDRPFFRRAMISRVRNGLVRAFDRQQHDHAPGVPDRSGGAAGVIPEPVEDIRPLRSPDRTARVLRDHQAGASARRPLSRSIPGRPTACRSDRSRSS